jgi:hypothetical protein
MIVRCTNCGHTGLVDVALLPKELVCWSCGKRSIVRPQPLQMKPSLSRAAVERFEDKRRSSEVRDPDGRVARSRLYR